MPGRSWSCFFFFDLFTPPSCSRLVCLLWSWDLCWPLRYAALPHITPASVSAAAVFLPRFLHNFLLLHHLLIVSEKSHLIIRLPEALIGSKHAGAAVSVTCDWHPECRWRVARMWKCFSRVYGSTRAELSPRCHSWVIDVACIHRDDRAVDSCLRLLYLMLCI